MAEADTIEGIAYHLNERAAEIANQKAYAYLQKRYPGDPDRSLMQNPFRPKAWNHHGPFGVTYVQDMTPYLDEDDKTTLKQIARLSVRQALADQPQLLAELIQSYTAAGENFFEAFLNTA